jgi:hypothetical protein
MAGRTCICRLPTSPMRYGLRLLKREDGKSGGRFPADFEVEVVVERVSDDIQRFGKLQNHLALEAHLRNLASKATPGFWNSLSNEPDPERSFYVLMTEQAIKWTKAHDKKFYKNFYKKF